MNEQEAAVGENAFPIEDIHTWRRRSVRELLRGAAIFGLPVLIVGLLLVRYTWLIPIYVAFYAGFVLLAFWRRSPYALQVAAIMALVYGLGVSALFEDGLSGDGRVFLLAMSVIAVLLFGPRQGLYALVLAGLTMAAFGWAYASGQLVIPEERVYSADWMAWLSGTVVFLLTGAVLLISQNYVLPRLAQALDRSRRLTQELQVHRLTLQQRVDERTALLRQRAEQFQAVAEVGRALAGIRDLDALIAEAVEQISQRFGFQATAIYFLDETRSWVVLQAALPDEAERDQRLPVGGQNLVSRVAATGQPSVAQPTIDGEPAQDDPAISEMHPEIALPLRVGTRLIGVLDLQAGRGEPFAPESASILSVLAEQLALAIENVRLLTETQRALEQTSRYREQETRDVWGQALQRRGEDLTYLYDQIATRPVAADEISIPVQKGDGQVSVRPLADGRYALVAPIQVHGQTIGSLAFEAPQAWESEEVILVETAVQQVGQALENARLLEEIQQRAGHEQLTGQVTARIRETLDVNTVLQTAVREMREALSIAEVEVRLDTALISKRE